MQITRSIKRTLAGALLSAGLAYPACAAVCPKGIGGCTSPGRCFLFVDADGNSLCDYTGRTGSASASGYPARPGASSQASPSVQMTTAADPGTTRSAVSSADTPSSLLQGSSSASDTSFLTLSACITEAVLFLLFTGIIFCLVRKGIPGVQVKSPLPALALSSLFGLGISLIASSIIQGSAVAGTTWALIYMSAGTLLAAYLWHAGVMTRRIALGAAALGVFTGFVFIAPIMPMELGGIVNAVTGTSAATAGVLVISSVIAVTLIVGRTFCSTICPVGSLQELAYAVPGRKVTVRNTHALELIRAGLFLVAVVAAVYLIDLMAVTGLYDLFSLTLSAGFVIALCLIALSVFLYRPVCRVLCPFGLLFSLCAHFSIFRLKRTDACIRCRNCETVCPTQSAGCGDAKRECYLCGRCTESCPRKAALAYQRG